MIRRAALALAAAAALAGAVQAAENAKVDAELLEFLGSIDAEEEGWQEYLEHKPVRPVEKTPPQKPAPTPRKPDADRVKQK